MVVLLVFLVDLVIPVLAFLRVLLVLVVLLLNHVLGGSLASLLLRLPGSFLVGLGGPS